MLETIRKYKSELPQQMNTKEVQSSSFYFTNYITVVNCIPKKKNVVRMSTLHHDNEVSNRNDKKPKMILDYNASNGAVDTFDQVTYNLRIILANEKQTDGR
ncbi:hypothetical protein ANN_27845 [Periplaneta americana]|uniref:PiggyBac transposable element-derived protein domain-containing protein n=1 Tax=Periplaneta americana TaxID=6978 RepID=A0ABQ8RVA2_PERAM|nr:hypothetical protein ANN_27845 [Periplaneta americana]